MNAKRQLNVRVLVAFGCAMAILLVADAISYRSVVASTDSDRWVRHTYDVQETSQNVLLTMERIQSHGRSFVVTGEQASVDGFRAGALRVTQQQAALRSLTSDNLEQQRALPLLDSLTAQMIHWIEAVIVVRQTQGIEAGAEAVRRGPGQRIMDEYQLSCASCKTENGK